MVGADEGIATELEVTAGYAQQRGGWPGRDHGAGARGAADRRPRAPRGRLLRAAELAFELGRRDLVGRLLGEVETLPLEPLDRARVTWIRESFDDGVTGGPVRRASARRRRRADARRRLGARGQTCSAAPRCAAGGATRALRSASGSIDVAGRLALDADDARLIAILAWADPVHSGAHVIERLSDLVPDPHGDGRAMRLYGMAATAVGHQELAAGFLGAAVTSLRADGRLALLAQALILRAWSGLHLGNWHASMPDLEEGGRLAVETSQPLWTARARAGQAALAGLRGEADVAEALAAEVDRVALPAHASAALADVQLARGMASLGAGNYADAHDQLWRVFDRGDAAHHYMKSLWAIGDLAEAVGPHGRRRRRPRPVARARAGGRAHARAAHPGGDAACARAARRAA